jgi:hypothetical protein
MAQQLRANPTLRWGLTFGVIAGLVSVGQFALPYAAPGTAAASIAGAAVFIVLLGLYFVAGILAGRRAGSTSSGGLAGLLAGVVATIIGGAVTILIVAVAPHTYAQAAGLGHLATPRRVLVALAFAGMLRGLLVQGSCGAGLGALGGLIGASRPHTLPPSEQRPAGATAAQPSGKR